MTYWTNQNSTKRGANKNNLFAGLLDRVENRAQNCKINLDDVMRRTVTAGELCEAYPHLNKDVVMAGMLLYPLIKEGCFGGGVQGAMELLSELAVEERVKILRIVTSAQTEFAEGEARIVQYFFH